MKAPVTIRFVSGREEKFEIEFPLGTGSQARLKEFVEKPHVVLQLGDELLIVPGAAIECISITLPKMGHPLDLGDIRSGKRLK